MHLNKLNLKLSSFIAFLALSLQFSFAEGPPEDIFNWQQDKVQYYFSQANDTLATIIPRSNQFLTQESKLPHWGKKKGTLWMALPIHQKYLKTLSSPTLQFVINYPYIYDFTLFVPQIDGSFRQLRGGHKYPKDESKLIGRTFTVDLDQIDDMAPGPWYLRQMSFQSFTCQ